MRHENPEPRYTYSMPQYVRSDGDLSDSAILLYGDIHGLCWEEGYCWASDDHLALVHGSPVRTMRRYLAELVKYGYIIVEKKSDGKTGVTRKIFLDEPESARMSRIRKANRTANTKMPNLAGRSDTKMPNQVDQNAKSCIPLLNKECREVNVLGSVFDETQIESIQEPPKEPVKDPPKPNPEAIYCDAFRGRYGQDPVISRKDAGIISQLYKSLSPKNYSAALAGYFATNDPFILTNVHEPGMLASKVNRWIMEGKSADIVNVQAEDSEDESHTGGFDYVSPNHKYDYSGANTDHAE